MTSLIDYVKLLQTGSTLTPGLEDDFPYPPHAPSHEAGGYDEIDIGSLSGTWDMTKTYVLSLPDRGTVTGQEALSTHFSAGAEADEHLTVSGNDVIVATGNGWIRKVDSHTDPLYACDWAASSKTIGLDEIWYVGVEYDSGTDRGLVVYHSAWDWNGHTDFPLGSVTRDSQGVHVLNNPQIAADVAQHAYHRIYETLPFKRADRLGGGIIAGSGTLNITVTATEFYDGYNEFDLTAKNTGGSDTFSAYYYDGAWQVATAQTQWDNLQYNNYGTGLATLGAAKWGLHELWADLDDELVLVYGQQEYTTEATALEATRIPVSQLPTRLRVHGVYLGRFVFQKSTTPLPDHVQSVFVDFAGVGAAPGNVSQLDSPDTSQVAVVAAFNSGHGVIAAPISAIADGDLAINRASFHLDETNNKLYSKWRESGGTYITKLVGGTTELESPNSAKTGMVEALNSGHVAIETPSSVIADGDLDNSHTSFHLDESNNKLLARIRESGGTYKTHTIGGVSELESPDSTQTEVVTAVNSGHATLATPASAIADGDLAVSEISFYLDETNDLLKVKTRESGGSYFTHTIGDTSPPSQLDSPDGLKTKVVYALNSDHSVLSIPNSAVSAGDLEASTISMYYDETEDALKAKAKDSGSVELVFMLGNYDFSAYNSLTAGTHGGSSSADSYSNMVLNTTGRDNLVNTSRSGNDITIGQGTYFVYASQPVVGVGEAFLEMIKTSDSSQQLNGPNVLTGSFIEITSGLCICYGELEVSTSTTYRFRVYTQYAVSTYGLGYAVNKGSREERYGQCYIRRIGPYVSGT